MLCKNILTCLYIKIFPINKIIKNIYLNNIIINHNHEKINLYDLNSQKISNDVKRTDKTT